VLSLTGDNSARFEAARIVLLAAAGRSTRSIAKEVGVSRGLSAFGGIAMPTMALKGCKTSRGLASSRSIRRPTDKRILKLLDKPPPEGFARWTGLCWPGRWRC